MRMRHASVVLVSMILASVPHFAFGALTPANAPTNCAAATNAGQNCAPSSPCSSSDKRITIYVPHNSPGCATSMEGCVATARKSLTGHCVPMTVDCVRLGQCRYATCASDSSNYGKYFNLGTITYRSALDMQMHTVQNVTCFVHDTGSAFRGRPDKLDLATTVCPTCTDVQAGAIARNARVDITGTGQPDTPTPTSGPAPLPSTQPVIPTSGAPSGYPSQQSFPQSQASLYPSSVQPYSTLSAPGITGLPSAPPQTYTSPISALLTSLFGTPATGSPRTSSSTDTVVRVISSSSVRTISNLLDQGGAESTVKTPSGGTTPTSQDTFATQPIRTAQLPDPVIATLQNIFAQMSAILSSIIQMLRR